MDYEIKPFVGVNEFTFGQDRKEIRNSIGLLVDILDREGYKRDLFNSKGIYVEYSSGDKVESFEINEPSKALYKNKNLLGMALSDVVSLFGDCKVEKLDEHYSFDLPDCGVSLCAPLRSGSRSERVVTSVLVYLKGYWQVSVSKREN